MRRLAPHTFTALRRAGSVPVVLAVLASLAFAANASAAQTYDCVVPAGPQGEAMQVTLSAASGGCPAPGEAIPREWIIGTPRVIGAPQAAVSGSAQRPAAPAPLVRAAPTPGEHVLPTAQPSHGVPAAAVAAVEQARSSISSPAPSIAAAAAAAAARPAAPATAARASSDLSGFAIPGVFAIAAALLAAGLAGARRGPRTATA
jgi:hypothetical protein